MNPTQTLLVVDDQPENLAVLIDLLEPHYRVIAAPSGQRALQLAASESPPDLILLDVTMPGLDGYQVLARLREDPVTRDIPVIFVTARDAELDEEHGLALGAADYITKPIRPAVVLARVLTQLENKQARDLLKDRNASLDARVAERTAQLQDLNRSLDSFVYSVSHDLKTPLRGIEGYSRLLEEDYADRLDDEGRLFIGNIRRSVTRMGELIDSLLAYSRMERAPPASAVVDLRALASSVLGEWAKEIADRFIVARVELPAGIAARADPEGLIMVLRNLLDNAVKFSAKAAAPVIEIGGRQERDSWVLWVRDNGIGFDMKYHDRIFELFQRLHREEDYPGAGVGLAMAGKATQRMGGRLWAESAPGQGASFYLSLPRAEREFNDPKASHAALPA